MPSVNYHPETDTTEHDSVSRTKKVMLYGWDATNLQAVKMGADSTGAIKTESFMLNDYEEGTPISYLGQENPSGKWMITKIDETSGISSRYASAANNPATTSYATAWTNRATLTYDTYSTAM